MHRARLEHNIKLRQCPGVFIGIRLDSNLFHPWFRKKLFELLKAEPPKIWKLQENWPSGTNLTIKEGIDPFWVKPQKILQSLVKLAPRNKRDDKGRHKFFGGEAPENF